MTTTAQELIDDGIAVVNPADSTTVIVSIPHIININLINQGLVEYYASNFAILAPAGYKYDNWTPEIKALDDNGNPIRILDDNGIFAGQYQMQTNPITAAQAVMTFQKWRFGIDGAKLLKKQTDAAGRAQAQSAFAAAATLL